MYLSTAPRGRVTDMIIFDENAMNAKIKIGMYNGVKTNIIVCVKRDMTLAK